MGGVDMTEPTKRTRKQIAYRRSEAKHKKAKVFKRDGNACVYCGTTEHLTLDHATPLAKGGGNGLSNLVTACRPCNSEKNDMNRQEYAKLRADRDSRAKRMTGEIVTRRGKTKKIEVVRRPRRKALQQHSSNSQDSGAE